MLEHIPLSKLVKIGYVVADLDGCEGGDFIRSICETVGMVHYSNAGEEGAVALVYALLEREIRITLEMATSPDSDNFGFEEEYVKETPKTYS